jgi:hypothetical protein
MPGLEYETTRSAPLLSERRADCAGSTCYHPSVERVALIFSSFDDAERADEEYYANLDPSERVDILLDLIEQHGKSLGETAQRFERVHRVTRLSQS